jgi:hypothetical protein
MVLLHLLAVHRLHTQAVVAVHQAALMALAALVVAVQQQQETQLLEP